MGEESSLSRRKRRRVNTMASLRYYLNGGTGTTPTTVNNITQGQEIVLANGLYKITPPTDEIFMAWYKTDTIPDPFIDPLPANLYASNSVYTVTAQDVTDGVSFYAWYKTSQDIANQILTEIGSEYIPANKCYDTCLGIYLSLGYDYINFDSVWQILQDELPALTAIQTGFNIQSGKVQNVWVGEEDEYNNLPVHQQGVLYVIK